MFYNALQNITRVHGKGFTVGPVSVADETCGALQMRQHGKGIQIRFDRHIAPLDFITGPGAHGHIIGKVYRIGGLNVLHTFFDHLFQAAGRN